jgi:hypothetical protein
MTICIECAVRYHEFREIQPSPRSVKVTSGRTMLPEAWIDGKRYRLDHVALYHVPCDQCRSVKGTLYTQTDD